MQLTKEQKQIIQSQGDIKINAVAGSGKTTTIIEYARTRPSGSKVLYIAFNKAVKLQALERFEKIKLHNVKVETAHSLAYKAIVFKHNYSLQSLGYSAHDLVEILNLNSIASAGQKHLEFVFANHVHRFASYFCNSSASKVRELNYRSIVSDPKSFEFVNLNYEELEKQTRLFLAKMDKGQIAVTHDFYLKKYQLAEPELNYDYILFDEGQDASAVMLDIFFKQKATKVIVGDTHQQIYGWRYAVNSLEQSDFRTFKLTESFRFGQEIADLAIKVLDWKSNLGQDLDLEIKGQAEKPSAVRKKKSKAIIGRTNLGLLLKAIEILFESRVLGKNPKIYFEGNINSYSYAGDGASLYDVLNLYNGNHKKISNKLLKQMKSVKEMQDYIDFTEDAQLSMMLEVVKKHGNSLPGILKLIKQMHVSDDEKHKADIVFSTVHKCKGMEYDEVELLDDFMSEEKLRRSMFDSQSSSSKLSEEINLLYVAITRGKSRVTVPQSLFARDEQEKASRVAKNVKVVYGLNHRLSAEKAAKKYKAG